jgi:diaminohydroxyphosphoribosylaminopyrimidine deaminase/5-amino-6-(5-phosphoribosylamino)uracil reductase
MVGTGTAMADDPQLTCRLPGLSHRSPVRVVIDRHLRIPPSKRLIAEAHEVTTWVITSSSTDPARRQVLCDRGVKVIDVNPNPDGTIGLVVSLAALGEHGITRLLVEGGGRLAAGLVRDRLVDRLAWVHAPLLIGDDGIPAIAGFGLEALPNAPAFERLSAEVVGTDLLTIFRVRR